jgi:hypothetical protein
MKIEKLITVNETHRKVLTKYYSIKECKISVKNFFLSMLTKQGLRDF